VNAMDDMVFLLEKVSSKALRAFHDGDRDRDWHARAFVGWGTRSWDQDIALSLHYWWSAFCMAWTCIAMAYLVGRE
jgi:hypothetical protein